MTTRSSMRVVGIVLVAIGGAAIAFAGLSSPRSWRSTTWRSLAGR